MVDSTNLPNVDINQIATDLNNKMDRDGVNATASVCIESWHDNNGNWYRVYSDGWCEQGGSSYAATSSLTTIQFIKAYSSTPEVFVNCQYSGTSQANYTFLNAVNITNTSFKVRVDTQGMNWISYGYIN